jgi:hypothetical protein
MSRKMSRAGKALSQVAVEKAGKETGKFGSTRKTGGSSQIRSCNMSSLYKFSGMGTEKIQKPVSRRHTRDRSEKYFRQKIALLP